MSAVHQNIWTWDRQHSEPETNSLTAEILRLESLASDRSWLWGHMWNPTWQSELVHITHSYHMRLHQQHHHTLCNKLEMNTTPPKLRYKIAIFCDTVSICKVCMSVGLFDLWLVDELRIKIKISAPAESLSIILEEVVTTKCCFTRNVERSVCY